MKNVSFTINNVDKWMDWLKQCENGDIERFKSRVLRTLGLRGLEYAQDLTPVQSGRLAGSENVGAPENYFEVTIKKDISKVVYGTNVEYAEYVEKGFDQSNRRGDFVPGFWRNGVFHYDPEAYPSGMVLTGKIVEGAHMFEKSLDYLEDDISTVYEFELRRLYNELKK